MRLNLIGNGFDLYHGLPCAYYHFACYLAKNDPDFYVEMARMFGFKYMRYLGFPEDDAVFIADDLFWKTFEEKLGELDTTWLEESLLDDLGLEYPDDPVELEIPEVANSQAIVQKFTEWIVNTVNTSGNFETIKDMIGSNLLALNENDYYINFNYTQTLEEVYDISFSRVFHIHGECDLDAMGDIPALVVGHGNKKNIEKLEKRIKEIEDDGYYLSSQEVKNRMSEYEAELHILKDLRKNVDSLIVEMIHNLELRSINPDEIWIWGLSCGEVDKPYIMKLKSLFPGVKWEFSYFNESEKERRKEFVEELGLTNVEYFHFANNEANRISEMLITENNIEELEKVF